MTKSLRLCVLVGLAGMASTPAQALLWNSRYENPGLYSKASAGYSIEANLSEDDPDFPFIDSDTEETATAAEVDAFVVTSSNSDVTCFGPGPCSGSTRAQTDFRENHAKAFSHKTIDRTGNDGEFFIRRHSSAVAVSSWVDHWTFTSSVLGGKVDLPVSVDVIVDEDTLCGDAGFCGQVGHPDLDQSSINGWSYTITASLAVFDLDQLVEYYPNADSEVFELVPKLVALREFSQIGIDSDNDFIEVEDPDGGFNEDGSPATLQIPNGKLNDLIASGVASFVPLPGRHYATVAELVLIAQNGVILDGFNTMTLDQIILAPGMTLHSEAVTQFGAEFNIVTSPVPLPAGLPLLASGVAALGGLAARRRKIPENLGHA